MNLQGRVASATTGCTGLRGGKVDELYSYNVAGAVVTKRVRITRGVSTVTKDIVYTYDGEGKLASTKYPDEAKPWVMGYDAMARPNGLTQEWWDGNNNQWVNRQWVNGVSYGNAGQLLGMSTFSGIQNFAEVRFTETREYNERLQVIRQRTLQGATVAMDLRYIFNFPNDPDPEKKLNDGRIRQRENVLSGETVSYVYDSLQRLVSAETTSAAWGLSFDYDGFGNRWEQLVTKGTAPGNVVSFNQATNRINSSLYSHDANGNLLSTPTVSGMTYDVENRLLTANGNGCLEEFAYLGDNKRVWKKANAGSGPVEQYYLYGVGGQRIATYSAVYSGGTLTLTYATKDVYFGGRVIWQNGKAVVQDRLGSVMARGNGTGGVETHDYYPYGEERTATVGDRNKFGTYHRDQTGLDYADQRYYNSAIGRFLTSDPYEASGRREGPPSWNRQSYVVSDPLNGMDPTGLDPEEPSGFCWVMPEHFTCLPRPYNLLSQGIPPPTAERPISPPSPTPNCHEIAAEARTNNGIDRFWNTLRFAGRSIGNAIANLRGELGAARDAGGMFVDWISESGPETRHFANGSIQSAQMASSMLFAEAVERFLREGIGSGWADFGIAGLVSSGANSTAQFVGSFGWNIVRADDGFLDVTLTNQTSIRSFFYHVPPKSANHERTPLEGGNAMGNMNQIFRFRVACP